MFNLVELFLLGISFELIFRKIKLPGVLGILFAGILLNNYLPTSFLLISDYMRQIALIIILLRAGFQIHKRTIKKLGFRILAISIFPGLCEGFVIMTLSYFITPLNIIESAMTGFIISAVSPAIVVPMMIDLKNNGYGVNKGIPTLVLASSSLDDICAIIVFSVILGCYVGGTAPIISIFTQIPLSIIIGLFTGIMIGYFLNKITNYFKIKSINICLVLVVLFFLLFFLEKSFFQNEYSFASLISIVATGIIFLNLNPIQSELISYQLGRLWIFISIFLFLFIGSKVDLEILKQVGWLGFLIILIGLLSRSTITMIALLGSTFTKREKLFITISLWPKATVQAVLGAIPLLTMQNLGISTLPGEWILAISVMSIIITAPLGAIMISYFSTRCLKKT